jgi:hypothetical protein
VTRAPVDAKPFDDIDGVRAGVEKSEGVSRVPSCPIPRVGR